MKRILFLILLIFSLFDVTAQRVFFTVSARQSYNVIGSKADTIGLYSGRLESERWKHMAWVNEIAYGIAVRDSLCFLSGLDGVLRSLDGGKTWKLVTDWRMPEAFQVYFDIKHSQTIYMVCSGGVWKSDNLGNTWKVMNSGLQTTSQTYVNTLLVLPDKILAGTADGIYIRKYDGVKWTPAGIQGVEVHDIRPDPFNSEHLVAATEDNGVQESFDGGLNWRKAGIGLEKETVYSVVFDPFEKDVLYCGGYKLGLCKLNTLASKWTRLENTVSNKSIHSIAVDSNQKGIIYMGLIDAGLYRSSDGGTTVVCAGDSNAKVWQVLIVP